MKKRRIISFDGGGIKGCYTLGVLEQIENKHGGVFHHYGYFF